MTTRARRDILGAPYTAETLELPDDEEGKVVATLVRRPAGRRTTDRRGAPRPGPEPTVSAAAG